MNRSGDRSLLVRPDICILKQETSKVFFDVKTDLEFSK
jgi:hypothetical protein